MSEYTVLRILICPHLRVRNSEFDEKAYAITKFGPGVIKAWVRWLREGGEVSEPWAHIR